MGDQNSGHPLHTLCWVAAVVERRFACGQTHGLVVTASSNCLPAWVCRDAEILPSYFVPVMVSVLAAAAEKSLLLESNWTWKCFWASPQTSHFLGSRSSSLWNSLALAELSSLCQCFLFSQGLWNFIFKSYTSMKSEFRCTKKYWNDKLSNPNTCIEINSCRILRRHL